MMETVYSSETLIDVPEDGNHHCLFYLLAVNLTMVSVANSI
jgi:hypothetical protein